MFVYFWLPDPVVFRFVLRSFNLIKKPVITFTAMNLQVIQTYVVQALQKEHCNQKHLSRIRVHLQGTLLVPRH